MPLCPSQMLALAVLDRVLSIDRQSQWLVYLCNSGYLRVLVESLRQDDAALQTLLIPQPPLLKPLYIYESKMVRRRHSPACPVVCVCVWQVKIHTLRFWNLTYVCKFRRCWLVWPRRHRELWSCCAVAWWLSWSSARSSTCCLRATHSGEKGDQVTNTADVITCCLLCKSPDAA